MATEVTIAESKPAEVVTTDTTEAAVETVADASVEIAKIEADKEIAIAEITAEMAVTQTEAVVAFNAETEISSCRQSIETLASKLTTMETSMLSIQERLIATELTPPSQPPAEGESLEVTPANPEEAEPPPMEKPTRKKKFRLI